MEHSNKSLATLELYSVLAMLAEEAVSEPAKQMVSELRPVSDSHEVVRRLAETSAAKELMTLKGSPSFSGVRDVRGSLARADIGGMLNTRELLDIAGVLKSARLVKAYASGDRTGRTDIDFLFNSLQTNRFLEDKITNSITGEDEIADAASAELASIRRHMRAASARVREALQKIISSPSYAKALQEPIITLRSGRYVVPVKAEHKNAVQGLVHDVSASGVTLFIEPLGAVKANNELRELEAKEKTEIERILMELSADVAGHSDDIARDFNVLIALDLIFAKAKLSYRLNAGEPVISDRQINLKRARHPMLPLKEAVPIDIVLGGDYDTLVITGPNTGGKTVCLKTLGLLSLMAQCGLHIPAADGSCVPVFTEVLADIGDEQSIEQSLSTFSSHMTNIVRILEECGAGSLLLFDELGAGTDPVEGAALAVSIIEHARSRGAIVAATTHYAELKVYATTADGVMNASCEFDVETLRPTYRLLIGIPGKSNAFAISERLGLDRAVIDDAKTRVDAESAGFEDSLARLEEQRQQMERDKLDTEKALTAAREAEKRADQMRRELTVRLEKADEKARREAERILQQAREAAETVFSELDEMRKNQTADSDWQRVNEARSAMRRSLNEAGEQLSGMIQEEPERKPAARAIEPGDTVQITAMGVKAQVISVSDDRVLKLQAGIMQVTAKETEVVLLENEQRRDSAKYAEANNARLRDASVSTELDLRGMAADEAIAVMERYIDNAVMSKLNTVTIIHGKGTGVLRQATHQSLKKNRQVKAFRLGRFGEGDAGVTVVELK